MKNIGILALQGGFAKHIEIVTKIGHNALEVRTNEQLWQSDALIIPGGESSTFLKIINRFDLFQNLITYAETRPIFGTCAGLIVLAKNADHLDTGTLGLIDISVSRNAYGRQKESFVDDVSLDINGKKKSFPGVFIRAPKIESIGMDVKVLGRHKDDIVMAGNSKILVCTFHPELTNDTTIHEYFFKKYLST